MVWRRESETPRRRVAGTGRRGVVTPSWSHDVLCLHDTVCSTPTRHARGAVTAAVDGCKLLARRDRRRYSEQT